MNFNERYWTHFYCSVLRCGIPQVEAELMVHYPENLEPLTSLHSGGGGGGGFFLACEDLGRMLDNLFPRLRFPLMWRLGRAR